MYEDYREASFHRDAAHWHKHVPPSKTETISHALQVDLGRYIVLPIQQRWHKDPTDGKGYESESDEGRRTKTEYIKHCARRKVDWSDGGQALRPKARWYQSLKLFVLSRP